jgi:hypothetical protein
MQSFAERKSLRRFPIRRHALRAYRPIPPTAWRAPKWGQVIFFGVRMQPTDGHLKGLHWMLDDALRLKHQRDARIHKFDAVVHAKDGSAKHLPFIRACIDFEASRQKIGSRMKKNGSRKAWIAMLHPFGACMPGFV